MACMLSTDALHVTDLTLTIKGKAILNNIQFSLPKGKILGVLGPNGAGKTSLLKMLSGQKAIKPASSNSKKSKEEYSQGNILWQNRSLADYSIQGLAQQIAVVNQINDTVFAVTLQQVVRMGLLPHKSLLSRDTEADKHIIQRAIQAVGLSDKIHQQFSHLSGGEQQRGLIAKALVQRSPLLMLDEPVNHLDVFYQHQILQLLHDLASQLGITVIMSLHDLNLAAHYCDTLCLLDRGELVAFGEPAQVLQSEQLTRVFRTPCSVDTTSENQVKVTFSPDRTQVLDLQDWDLTNADHLETDHLGTDNDAP